MRNRYTLYSEIKDDLRVIAKLVLDADDGFAELRWRELKEEIHSLAEMCTGLMKERKEADRRELAERRQWSRENHPIANEQAPGGAQ